VWSVFWVSLIGCGVVPRIWRGSDSVAQAGGRCLKGHFYILTASAVAIVLASFARGQNVAFLVGLAFAVAASANLPTILFSLYWKRFNTNGAVVGILVGWSARCCWCWSGPT
jgi:Na+(H+)/acetate symporter ActP